MPSVRIQLTVGSEMSLDFARFDVSKLCDTHAIVMRKELCGAALPGRDVPRSGWKEEGGSALLPAALGCLASTRRSQDDGGLGKDCSRLFALTRIHDLVRCSIVRTFLAP